MAIFRSYLAAQASLIRGNGTNSSRNPIIELSYGGSADPATTQISRFVFRLNLTGLKAEVAAGRLREQDVIQHEVFFKNVVALAPAMRGGQVEDARRGSGVTVELHRLLEGETIEEGTGFEYFYAPGAKLQAQAAVQAPNWFYRQTGVLWTTEGGLTVHEEMNTYKVGDVRVGEGTEDLRFDLTDYVQQVLFAAAPEATFLLRYDEATEQLTSCQRHVITFFSRHTHHFFEPYLETVQEPPLQEIRHAYPLDEESHLYLQIPAQMEVQLGGVNIYDENERLVYTRTAEEVEQVRPGLYRTPLRISSLNYEAGAVFADEWLVTREGAEKRIEQEFTVTDPLLDPLSDPLDTLFSLSLAGLRHNELISRAQTRQPRRVTVNWRGLRRGNLVASCGAPSSLEYRVYTPQGKEQVEVIPPTECYRVGGAIYFELDPRWMVAQHYVLEVSSRSSDGTQVGSPLQIKFRVVN